MNNNKIIGKIISNAEIEKVRKQEIAEKEEMRRKLEYQKMIEEKRREAEYIRQRTKAETDIHLTIKEYLKNPYKKLIEIQFYFLDLEETFDDYTHNYSNTKVEKLVNIYCNENNIRINEFNEIILRTKPVGVFVGEATRETKEVFEMELPLGIITGIRILNDKPKYKRINIQGFVYECVENEIPKAEPTFKIAENICKLPPATDLTFFILDRIIDNIKINKIDISEYGVGSRYRNGFTQYPELPKEINREFMKKFQKGGNEKCGD